MIKLSVRLQNFGKLIKIENMYAPSVRSLNKQSDSTKCALEASNDTSWDTLNAY